MKAWRQLVLSLTVVLMSAENAQSTYKIADPAEEVSEAALRHFLANSRLGFAPKVICISTGTPLALGFIDGFQYRVPRVVWSIDCTTNLWEGIRYIKTNEPAVLLHISRVRWISTEKAEVEGLFQCGDFPERPRKILLMRKNNVWIVKKESVSGFW
jgi:hypothetical protein